MYKLPNTKYLGLDCRICCLLSFHGSLGGDICDFICVSLTPTTCFKVQLFSQVLSGKRLLQ